MTPEEFLDDLEARFMKAQRVLDSFIAEAQRDEDFPKSDLDRLVGKNQGVSLCLSYLKERGVWIDE